ncbi:MAG: nitrous oxide reductase accessory protein NosL [Proteobacteria bacterium]|nr:nitrous oxide reductase accessory protein NosL [Pseudomonadota bacterium]
MLKLFIGFIAAVSLVSCGQSDKAAMPAAQELTRDAIGYYCMMTVVEHQGPKGQIILTDKEDPLWFTSVRDTMAFTILPGEPKNIAAIYVTDIGKANWDNPEPSTWIDARQAWFVVGSDVSGGMGAPELVPFGEKAEALAFIQEHGGEIFEYADIPREMFLGVEDS